MKKQSRQTPHNETLGLPGRFNAVDETFRSPEQMCRSIDAFLNYLYRTYDGQHSSEDKPSLFGFLIKKIRICRDPKVQEVEIWSDPACGVAVIHAPEITGETGKQWEERCHYLMGLYWPSLQDAQIRATVQLYRTLSVDARNRLEKQEGKLKAKSSKSTNKPGSR